MLPAIAATCLAAASLRGVHAEENEFTDPDPTNTDCDSGPDAMTNAFVVSPDLPNVLVPRICIDTPGLQSKRCYYIYVPDCVEDADGPVPLLFDNHGRTSCPQWSAFYTGWAQKATEECFVVVWPLGTIDPEIADQSCFSAEGGITDIFEPESGKETSACCCEKGGDGQLVDPGDLADPTFLRVIAAEVVANHRVDPKRVYMGGHSNGCSLSTTMAAQHSDIVAAVCCHAGFPVTPVAEDYEPVPTWLAHGQKDTTIPYNGIFIPKNVFNGDKDFWLMSAPGAAKYFAKQNGCNLEEGATSSVETGSRTRYSNGCSAPVELITIPTAGHRPFIRYVPWVRQLQNNPDIPMDTLVDTTAWAWDFCSAHAKDEVPKAFREDGDFWADEWNGTFSSFKDYCSARTDRDSCTGCNGRWNKRKGCSVPSKPKKIKCKREPQGPKEMKIVKANEEEVEVLAPLPFVENYF